MEFPILILFFSYIYYLRYCVDSRTASDIEKEKLAKIIALYDSGHIPQAFEAFSKRIIDSPKSAVSYLYRGLCHKEMENFEAAEKDFREGITYDNTNSDLYTELGKLQRDSKEMELALASFATAIRVSRGEAPEPYHERGIALQMLGKQAEAEIDFGTEEFINQQAILEKLKAGKTVRPPLIDRKLLLNSLLVILTSAILLASVKTADSIHLPYLTAVLMSAALGFAEPRRGWMLAILQSVIVVLSYTFLLEKPATQGRTELEYFSMYGAVALTFASSFLGAFLKRAITS